MPDRLESAASGRAKCRGCGAKIEKDTLRFGEVLPRPSGDDDATSVYWFHPRCAAHRRPEKFAQLLRSDESIQSERPPLPERDALLAEADEGVAHHRLARIAGAEPASSGRAKCRHCKEPIAMGLWRIRLGSFAESGFPEPLGFVHTACCPAYFGVPDIVARVRQASPDLGVEQLEQITDVLRASATST